MPSSYDYVDQVRVNGSTYNIKDTVSGYINDVVAGNNITVEYDSEGNPVISSTASGSVESVSASGILSSSGGANPNITHNAPSTSPEKTTKAIYPIKIDSYGHITEVGRARELSVGTIASNILYAPSTAAYGHQSASEFTSEFLFYVKSVTGSGASTTIASGQSPVTKVVIGESTTVEITSKSFTVPGLYLGWVSDNVLIARLLVDEYSIPAVNDGKLNLQKDNGTASQIYTANQSTNTTLKFTTSSVGSASGWNAGSVTTIDTTKFNGGSFTRGAFSGGSFTQGTDSFTANTPTVIDTTKFSGGSFTAGTFSGGSFTQGTDSFTANTPTVINTAKFSGGSFTRGIFSGGSFTQGSDSFTTNTPTAVSYSVSGSATLSNPGILILLVTPGSAASFTQGTDSFSPATHAADSFTAASLQNGFYTAGTSASFTQGNDTFVAATKLADTFTPASISNGFYTAGTAASFTQGTDSFTAATHAADTFTPASLSNGFYSAGTAPTLTVSNTTVVNDISAS